MGTNHLTHDDAAQARYRRYQDERIGPDPLADGAHDWPDLAGGITLPRKRAITGWRVWGVVPTSMGPRLVAPYRPDWSFGPARWHPGKNTASTFVCTGTPTSHPGVDGLCRCGFRIVQSWTVLSAFLDDQRGRLADVLVAAEVDAWGRIAPAAPDDDWQYTARVQHAEVRDLYLSKADRKRYGAELAEHYGVPIGKW